MAGVPASENSPAVAGEPVQADLQFNFNILFFQSTRMYKQLTVWQDKSFDTRCYDKINDQ